MVAIESVCVVTAGNAAQTLAALLPFKGFRTRVFTSFGDEAERLAAALGDDGVITANFAPHLTPSGVVQGRPEFVTNDAGRALAGANVVVLPLPSFAYADVFAALKPHLRPDMFLFVTPGQGSFDWIAQEVLGEAFAVPVWVALMPMPFNCRVQEFGKVINVEAYKQAYKIAVSPVSRSADALSITEQLFFPAEAVGCLLTANLMPLNPCIHPQRLYALLKDYKPGDVLPENPLFYESMNDESTALMQATSDEVQAVSAKLRAHGVDARPYSILVGEQFTWPDGMDKAPGDLTTIFRTSSNYKTFRCPFREVKGGFEPNFENRYFTEDIPFGLCVYKGVAEIAGVPTPTIDRIIEWAQRLMGKEYLVGGRLVGKDVASTTAPQRFGITRIDQLDAQAAPAEPASKKAKA